MAKKVSSTQERLSEMMKELNISAADIARRTGINKSTLSHYINGKRTAVQDKLSKIADPYGIDPAWLMGYDVPMRLTDSIENYDSDFVANAVRIYKGIYDLPPDKRKILDDFLLFLQSGDDSPH